MGLSVPLLVVGMTKEPKVVIDKSQVWIHVIAANRGNVNILYLSFDLCIRQYVITDNVLQRRPRRQRVTNVETGIFSADKLPIAAIEEARR